ncbi:U-scoloptoxin(01)-Cw1a [Spodoptera frugiperda]|uniref:SFRICE_012842 n=1 Tax=Spodoptera frugiperda TaxID=7108 RepID=A0A2H1V689_SPOFR|nr:U-scoloptoxin(01)-Cw1a [Spodoptera frugiperda]
MCGEMGKAVLRALTGALLCGLVSDAAYLQQYDPYETHYEQAIIRPKPLREHEKPQDLRNVPGTPGVDFPIYHSVPDTSFSCDHVPVRPGMYANVETGCQAYHVCHDGREGQQGASFLCTNGTLFDQAKFACDWWYNVDCSKAITLYKLNADPYHNPFIPKPKPEEEVAPAHPSHGLRPSHGIYYRKI